MAADYAGYDLGLPPPEPGSVGTQAERALPAMLDWALFTALKVFADISDEVGLAVFVLTMIVLPWLLGVTPGKLAGGLRLARVGRDDTMRTDQRGVPLPAVVVRTVTVWVCQPVSGLVRLLTMDRNNRPVQDRLCRAIVLGTR